MDAPSAHDVNRTGRRLKALGLLACAFVLGELLLFAVGEGAEGLGHVVQAAPLALLLIIAWWRPLVGGALIVVVAVGLAVAYWLSIDEPLALLVALFFAPALVGGLLLVAGGWLELQEAS